MHLPSCHSEHLFAKAVVLWVRGGERVTRMIRAWQQRDGGFVAEVGITFSDGELTKYKHIGSDYTDVAHAGAV